MFISDYNYYISLTRPTSVWTFSMSSIDVIVLGGA